MHNVSENKLQKTVKQLVDFKARYTWQEQTEVAGYLFERFQKYGLQVSFDEYDRKQKKWKNVIATIEGKKRLEDIYMVIAHFDSISDKPKIKAPGADDDGSGTAAVLEIARILNGLSLASTVKFGIFSNEEQKHAGSKHFTAKAREEGMNIVGVINLDIIGYNDPMGSLSFQPSEKTGIKKAIKLELKKIRGYFLNAIHPNGIITVAGRPPNRNLVEQTSALTKKYSNLGVKDDVRDDCA